MNDYQKEIIEIDKKIKTLSIDSVKWKPIVGLSCSCAMFLLGVGLIPCGYYLDMMWYVVAAIIVISSIILIAYNKIALGC